MASKKKKSEPVITSTDDEAGDPTWKKRLRAESRAVLLDESDNVEEAVAMGIVRVADDEVEEALKHGEFVENDLEALKRCPDSELGKAAAVVALRAFGLQQQSPLPNLAQRAVFRARARALVDDMDRKFGADLQLTAASRAYVVGRLVSCYGKMKKAHGSAFESLAAYLQGGVLCVSEACGCLEF